MSSGDLGVKESSNRSISIEEDIKVTWEVEVEVQRL